jgi:hypothetical protein
MGLLRSSLVFDRSGQQPWWFHFDVSTSTTAITQWGRDNEEFRRYKFEFGGQRKKAGVQRGFDFSLFKGFTMVKVGVGKYPSQPSSKRGKVSVR